MTTFLDKSLKTEHITRKTTYMNQDGVVTPKSLFELELSDGYHLKHHACEILVDFKEPKSFGKTPFWLEQQQDVLITIEKLNQLQKEYPL